MRNSHHSLLYAQGYSFPNLLVLIQYIFTDQFIYAHTDMLELFTSNPKGFILIRKLLQLTCFKKLIRQTQFFVTAEQIERIIKSESKMLICRNFQVRRIKKFENKYEEGVIFPTFIENFEKDVREEQMRGFLEQFTSIYELYFKAENRWCFVFSENPNAILTGIAQYKSANLQSKIKAYKVRQSIDIYQTSLKLFNKHIFEQIHQNKDQSMNIQNIRRIDLNILQNGVNNTGEISVSGKKYHKDMIEEFEFESRKKERERRENFLRTVEKIRNFDNSVFYDRKVIFGGSREMKSESMIEEQY